MSHPPKERRSSPRLDDPAIRFRWLGARHNGPIANFSLSGAKLLTTRSAPVGSLLEFELQHIDGSSLSLLGTVRRVERPSRRAGGDGLLALSVEFRRVSEQHRATMERWRDSPQLAASDTGVDEGVASEISVEPAEHEGRLWESSDKAPQVGTGQVPRTDYPSTPSGARRAVKVDTEVSDLFEIPLGEPQPAQDEAYERPSAERSSMVADQEELIAQLQHRLARAEAAASEALANLAGAEERLEHLGLDEDEPRAETPGELDPPIEAAVDSEQALEPPPSGAAPLMVDALLDTGEQDQAEASEEVAEDHGTRPISAAVRNFKGVRFSSAVREPADLAESRDSTTDDDEQASDEVGDDALGTRAFSRELLEAARAASDRGVNGVSLGVDNEPDGQGSEPPDAQAKIADLDEEWERTTGAGTLDAGRRVGGLQEAGNKDPEPTAGGFVGAIPAADGVSVDLSDQFGPAVSDDAEESTRKVSWPELELEPADSKATVLDQKGSAVSSEGNAEDSAKAEDDSEDPDTAGWFPDDTIKALAAEIGAEEISADESAFDEPGVSVKAEGFGADESDDALAEAFASPVSSVAPLTFREVPSREGMVEAMVRGSIVRTERFSRLEPVSRADIQISDLLLETDDIRELEERAVGKVDRDQLYKVLYVFFQRGLIEIEVGARG